MKTKMKNTLLGILSCGMLATAALGATAGVHTASAASVVVKPTGLNTTGLTQAIDDNQLDTFKVYGASTRKTGTIGFRFLATIEKEDLRLIPNDVETEFGLLLMPQSKISGEMTAENSSKFPALVETDTEEAPAGGLGYYITLMGETLEEAFPNDLYNTVLAARAYVKYTYTEDGVKKTDYAYSAETLYRSIAYVASCELVSLENDGHDFSLGSSDYSGLEGYIESGLADATLSFSDNDVVVGETLTVSLSATDGVNGYRYNLSSSNEEVVRVNENGELEAVGNGTATITANIGGVNKVAELTVGDVPTFEGGNILYSTADGAVFMPDGLLDEGETIVSATSGGTDYFAKGEWTPLELTEEQIAANAIGETALTVKTSNGDLHVVTALSYAGVIDELSDFTEFFKNEAVANTADNAATYPMVAPDTYGYYIVVKDLGTADDELAFDSQTTNTNYHADNGFNGVLDGAGHTLRFKLTSGGLVGMVLGNATIKNLAVIYEDGTYDSTTKKGGYGVFGYITNGSPVIENCYIERTNNLYHQGSVFGIMGRPNAKLILRNTAVHANNTSNTSGWYTNMWISEASQNAFLIYARAGAISTPWPNITNFTEVVTENTLTTDLSSLDTNYWKTDNSQLSWKGLANISTSEYEEKFVQNVAEKGLYSTQSEELIMPEGVLADGETVKTVYDVNFAEYAMSNLALTAEQMKANAIGSHTVIVETSLGNFYQLDVNSYAGVINELSDFPDFFDNEAVENTNQNNAADYPMIAPSVYGYYVVTQDLGTGAEVLSLTQCAVSNFTATCGFNGVLDGQGHTLRFKLMSGGLVGQILGNATIKNLGIIYEDLTSTYYGVFGYMTHGAPVIENCYIERTNNTYQSWSVFGIMSRPNARLTLKNTVVYGYNISNECAINSNMWISASSTNAYLIHAREEATDWVNVKNFTVTYNDDVENGSRDVPLVDLENTSAFNSEYWYKQNGRLIWKGFEVVNVSWVDGETITKQAVTKGGAITIPEVDGMYWSKDEAGEQIFSGTQKINADMTLYAQYLDKTLDESALYSTVNNELFLPTEIGGMGDVDSIVSEDGATIYYENGEWLRPFALTAEQIQNNEVVETPVVISAGSDTFTYRLIVKSYAGVIDELSDFPAFFDNDPSATHPNTYGYYIVVKDLGSYTVSGETFTYADDLKMTQSLTTDYTAYNGFNGVLDGAGHTLKFNLTSGGLVGNILGACTIKNLAVFFNDSTTTYYGVFGYMAMTGGPVIDNCYIQQTNNHYQKTTSFGVMGRPLGRLVMHNTVVYGFNNNHVNSQNGEASAPISTNSTNVYVICGRSAAATMPQATGYTKVYTDGSGEPYDTNSNKKFVPIADVVNVSGFNDCWSQENDKLTWQGADDMAVESVGKVTIAAKNLAENGETQYTVVLPTNADATLTTAKDELVSLFAEATGATIHEAEDYAYDTYGTYISIGDTKAFAASGVSMGEMNSQGYHLERKNNAIYINGESSLGCLYGVYGLLKELFEFEQFSADCYTLTSYETVGLPTVAKTESPDIAIRMPSNGAIIGGGDTYQDRIGMSMTENELFFNVGDYVLNANESANKGWRVWHNSLEILPVNYWKNGNSVTVENKTAKTPNEVQQVGQSNVVNSADGMQTTYTPLDTTLSAKWFAEVTGDESVNQLCYTARGDETAYNKMVEEIVRVMSITLTSSQITSRPNAKYLTLTSEDGEGVCTCDACTAANTKYGSNAGAVIQLCNDVMAGVQTWMDDNPTYKRDVKLLFFAYNDYVDAPTAGTIEMREDVGVMYAVSDYVNYYFDINNSANDAFRTQFDAWAALANASGSDLCMWTYTKNFSMYMLRADVYGEDAFFNQNAYAYFAEKGVDLWFNQGATNGTTTLSAFEKLNGYLDAQLMWDSTQNVDTLTDKWFTAMYGAGATYMKSLYAAQNTAARSLYGTTKLGIPTVQIKTSSLFGKDAKDVLTTDMLNTWLGYIDNANSAVNADTSLTDDEKAAYIDRINEEWLSVKFWQVFLYKSSYYGVVDTTEAQTEFRAVLGYDESTGTYAKDVTIYENASTTLVDWVKSEFTADI